VTAAATAAAPTSAAVPWSSVGAGWVLAMYSTGTSSNRGATTLELVSPAGAKYPMHTWAKSVKPPRLVAWSPSKSEALLQAWSTSQTSTVFDRLNLRTGTITIITLARTQRIASYTLPTGLQLLAEESQGTPVNKTWTDTVERVTSTGQPAKVIVTLKNPVSDMFPVYAPDGASIAIAYSGGVAVVSNAGGPVKRLPVPALGMTTATDCLVTRWWNTTTILATCGGRLWLVPANGAKPTALPQFGSDVAAWHLPSGLYVNSFGACGVAMLSKQNAHGSHSLLHIPGLGDPYLRTAAGPRFLIESDPANVGCGPNDPGSTVAWYNPATGAKTVLFAKGVFGLLPFPNVADAANGY
jgi:TolB protein